MQTVCVEIYKTSIDVHRSLITAFYSVVTLWDAIVTCFTNFKLASRSRSAAVCFDVFCVYGSCRRQLTWDMSALCVYPSSVR